MAAKFVILAAFVAVAHGSGVALPAVAKTVISEPYDPNPQYSYGYEVQDPLTGDSHGQVETRNGDVVQGSYALLDSDGTRRQVDYTADPINGFNAVVSKQALAAPVVAKVAAPVAAPLAAPVAPLAAPVAPVAAPLASAFLRAAPLAPLAAPVAPVARLAAPIAPAPLLRSAPLLSAPLLRSAPLLSAPLLRSAPLAPLAPIAPALRAAPLW